MPLDVTTHREWIQLPSSLEKNAELEIIDQNKNSKL